MADVSNPTGKSTPEASDWVFWLDQTDGLYRKMLYSDLRDAIRAQLASPLVTGTIQDTVEALSGTTPDIDPTAGAIKTWTLTGNSEPTESLSSGQAVLLMIDDGTGYTITWSAVDQWLGGSAPTLPTTGYAAIVLMKIGTTVYGQHVGDFS